MNFLIYAIGCFIYNPILVVNHDFLLLIQWRNRYSNGLAINRSWVQILLAAKLRDNLEQVVHTYVPLSPSSITCYRPKGGDGKTNGNFAAVRIYECNFKNTTLWLHYNQSHLK